MATVDFQSLIHALMDDGSEAQMQALQKLHELAREKEGDTFKLWTQDYALSLRYQQGLVPLLLELCVCEEGGFKRTAALSVCKASADNDLPNFAVALIKEGMIRKFSKLTSIPLMSSNTEAVHHLAEAIDLLSYVTKRKVMLKLPHATEELFTCGHMANIARAVDCQDHENFSIVQNGVIQILFGMSNERFFRERIRDLGAIPNILKLSVRYSDMTEALGTVYNLSRSESIHTALQDAGLLEAMDGVLHSAKNSHIQVALIAVAHVYASQGGGPAARLLTSRDISISVMGMLDAGLHGDGWYKHMHYSLEEVAHAAKSLSRSEWLAERMAKAGLAPMLVELLTTHEKDEEAVMHACEALLSCCNLQHLRAGLLKAGVPDAARKYAEHPEIRIQDAAKGCLLQLGVLDDEAAKHANQALELSGCNQTYDVFLSHKRTDAKDFARALYNLLVLRGIATFLDFEYQEELQLETGLSNLVASCRNFVFVLTDNVLSSKWCLQELEAAVDNRVNIILVVKEGSRWKDDEGRKSSPFPGPNVIAELPEKVKPVFTRKAIHHSDEYYSSFIDMLMKKVTANKPPPEEPSRTSGKDPTLQQHAATLPAFPLHAQQHSAALPALPLHAQQPPSAANQPYFPSSLPSAPNPVAPSIGAPGNQVFQSGSGLLPADVAPHFTTGGVYGGSMAMDVGNSAVLTELAQLHRSMDVRHNMTAAELSRMRQEQQLQMQQLRMDMMAELQQLRMDVLGEVRRSRQVTADADGRVTEAHEGMQRTLLGLQSRLAGSLTMHPPPMLPPPFPSVSYTGYTPYPPAVSQPFPHAMPGMPLQSASSASMQGADVGSNGGQPSLPGLEGRCETSGPTEYSSNQQHQQQQQPFPRRAAPGTLPPLVQGEGLARSRGAAPGGAGRGRV